MRRDELLRVPNGIVQPSWRGTGQSHGVNRRFLAGLESRSLAKAVLKQAQSKRFARSAVATVTAREWFAGNLI